MSQSDNINELATALSKFQGEITAVKKDATAGGGSFKYRYATLDTIWEAIRKPLEKNGLSVVQVMGIGEHGNTLGTKLLHSSGQYIEGVMSLNPEKDTPQGLGSAITYARRYSLSAILGIVADEDDDAESATEHKATTKKAPAKKPTTKKKEFDTTTIEGALEFLEDKYPEAWGHLVVAAKIRKSYEVTGDTMGKLIANLSAEQKEKFSTIVSEAVLKANK